MALAGQDPSAAASKARRTFRSDCGASAKCGGRRREPCRAGQRVRASSHEADRQRQEASHTSRVPCRGRPMERASPPCQSRWVCRQHLSPANKSSTYARQRTGVGAAPQARADTRARGLPRRAGEGARPAVPEASPSHRPARATSPRPPAEARLLAPGAKRVGPQARTAQTRASELIRASCSCVQARS